MTERQALLEKNPSIVYIQHGISSSPASVVTRLVLNWDQHSRNARKNGRMPYIEKYEIQEKSISKNILECKVLMEFHSICNTGFGSSR